MFGTTELPDKPIMLPPFVDPTHCLPYYLTRKGRAVADRVVSVLAYVCPDITYSPTIYPIAAILLHFMSGKCITAIDLTLISFKTLTLAKNFIIFLFFSVLEEECYHCLANLVAAKEKVFITQTKLLYEVTWKTVMQIAKKHAVSVTSSNGAPFSSEKFSNRIIFLFHFSPIILIYFEFCLLSNIEISCSSFTTAISWSKNGTCFHELDVVGADRSSVSPFSSCDGLFFP